MKTMTNLRGAGVLLALSAMTGCGARVSMGPDDASVAGDVAIDDGGARGDAVAQADTPMGRDVLSVTDAAAPPDAPVRADVPARADVSPSVDVGAPVECPSTIDGDGLACARPGEGCAAAGGGCDTSCLCGSDRRWHCSQSGPDCRDGGTLDVEPPPDDASLPDVFTPDGPPPDVSLPDGGACSLRRTWRVDADGMTIYFVFGDTAWGAGFDPTTALTTSVVGGSYTYTGGVLTLREDRPGMGMSCGATDEGVYQVYWSPSCEGFDLAMVREDCDARGSTLSRVHFSP